MKCEIWWKCRKCQKNEDAIVSSGRNEEESLCCLNRRAEEEKKRESLFASALCLEAEEKRNEILEETGGVAHSPLAGWKWPWLSLIYHTAIRSSEENILMTDNLLVKKKPEMKRKREAASQKWQKMAMTPLSWHSCRERRELRLPREENDDYVSGFLLYCSLLLLQKYRRRGCSSLYSAFWEEREKTTEENTTMHTNYDPATILVARREASEKICPMKKA